MAMLFLIENLVNFWVLTSSYVYLQIKMPDFLKDTINSIYEDYNESFLAYLGFYIPEPNIWTALPATSCGSRCQFNFVDFFM